jgi:hypothetical protein
MEDTQGKSMYNQYIEQKTKGGDNKGAQQRQRQAEKARSRAEQKSRIKKLNLEIHRGRVEPSGGVERDVQP